MNRCDHCPIRSTGTCIVEVTAHARYCEWAASSEPAKVAKVIELSGRSAGYPPLLEQAGNFLGAIARTAVALVSGEQVKASQEEFNRRIAICHECPEFDKDQKRCKACGCKTALKPWFILEKCPLGKWEQGT